MRLGIFKGLVEKVHSVFGGGKVDEDLLEEL